MRIKVVCTPVLLLAMSGRAIVGAAEVPKAVLPGAGFDFGKVVRGAVVEHDFVLNNRGKAPLRIVKVSLTAPLTVARMPAQISPGGQGLIRARLDTTNLSGAFKGQILVFLNDPAMPEARLSFTGQVAATIEVSPVPAFFLAAVRGQTRRQSLEIISHEAEPLQIHAVEHSEDRFTTALEAVEQGKRYRLTLTLNPHGPDGRHTEPVTLKTSSKTHPVLRIAANTWLREQVYTFPDRVDLGALPVGQLRTHPAGTRPFAQTLMVYQVGGSDFQVTTSSDLPVLELKSERGPKGDRYQITITLIEKKIKVGAIKGSIFIETNDPAFPKLTVPVSGLILER